MRNGEKCTGALSAALELTDLWMPQVQTRQNTQNTNTPTHKQPNHITGAGVKPTTLQLGHELPRTTSTATSHAPGEIHHHQTHDQHTPNLGFHSVNQTPPKPGPMALTHKATCHTHVPRVTKNIPGARTLAKLKQYYHQRVGTIYQHTRNKTIQRAHYT